MLNKLARGAVLVILAAMVVAWAVSVGKSTPAESQDTQPLWQMYT